MDTHSQEEEQEKPYQFKRHEAEKDKAGNITKPAYFKVYKRGTDQLLEGFELEEFNSPLVGHRYVYGLLKAIDAKIDAAVTALQPKVRTSDPSPENQSGPRPVEGGAVELPGDEDSAIKVIGGTRYFEIVVHEQDSDAKRKDVYLTDGVSRDFHIMYDVPVILPKGCLNVLRESIYTQHECIDDVQHGKVLLIEKQVPRFSIQVNREVPQEEAEAWLADRKKIFLQKV